MEETTVSMVSTPRSPATAPRAPASRAQTLPQSPPRPSHPIYQQVSKILHDTVGTVPKQKHLFLSSPETIQEDRYHVHTCMFTLRVTPHYILFVICTNTHPHTQREGRVLSFGVTLCL